MKLYVDFVIKKFIKFNDFCEVHKKNIYEVPNQVHIKKVQLGEEFY